MITCRSTPGASMSPSTSTMRPAGPRVGVGQRVIATVTISPGCAPLVSVGWTWMSTRIFLSNGTT
jgi:hypothetical protein